MLQVERDVAVEVNTVVRGALPALRGLCAKTTLDFTPTALPTFVLASAADLDQILAHLVSNAREGMPRGGAISIATWTTSLSVVLSVADRGTGVIDEVRLALVDVLARRANAVLAVTAVRNVGSTFEVSFPSAKPQ